MYLSQQDLLTGAISLAIIILALAGIEVAVKKLFIKKLIGRKLLHVIAICTCAFAMSKFENAKLLAGIFLVFFFVLLAVINKGWMQVNEYKTYGIALFPLAFALLLLIPVFQNKIIVFAALTLGICDAVAGITGEYFGKQKIIFLFEQKSWAGFAAFYASCFLLSAIYFQQFSLNGFVLCSLLALAPALTELFSYKGSDNLSVPVATAVWTYLIFKFNPQELSIFALYILAFLLFCFFAVYKKWLTVSGATAALWMALFLFITGGLKAFIAPGIFLLSGSLLSKLNKNDKEKNGRDAVQVFCNGIIGITCLCLFALTNQHLYLLAALVSFCVSMSDSVSSELGTFIKGTTIDIISFKKLPPGVSGGISWQGTLAGFAGGLILAAPVYFVYHFTPLIFIWITFGGFVGMLVDSILGSLLQRKFINNSGEITDDAEPGAIVTAGFSWCNNNMVNIVSNIIITLLFILLCH
jgi:uncharacterized protein (TIGR00297 family)